MNVEKDSFKTHTLLSTREPTQVSSLIPVVYAEETSAGGQAFLDIRNSTSERKIVQCLHSEQIQVELDPKVYEKIQNYEA